MDFRTRSRLDPRSGRAWPMVAVVALCAACAPAVAQEQPSHPGNTSASPAAHAMPVAGPTRRMSPADVRYALEQVLGHHSILMVRLMRGPIDHDRAFVAAAQVVLDRNTAELTSAVRQSYGGALAARFRVLWLRHITALQAYAEALGAGNGTARAAAMRELEGYARVYGDFIQAATSGRLRSAAVGKGVQAHIHHLVAQADAYAAKDYAGAFRLEREAYSAMFSTGKALAGAVVSRPSGELPAGFDSPPQQIRSALGLLLGEHVELAFDATRAIVAGSPAAADAARALDGNTRDITGALQATLGHAAAQRFNAVWAAHIDALVAFAVAVADNDEPGQEAARRRIDTFPPRLTAVLSGIAGGRVAAANVVSALREHDQQLLQQVTAYAAKDYGTAQEIAYDGYAHMFTIATTLAHALEGRAAAHAPHGGAATGGGGTARR